MSFWATPLPGFMKSKADDGVQFVSLSDNMSGPSTTFTIDSPSSVSIGNLLISVVSSGYGSTSSFGRPSGWTNIRYADNSVPLLDVSYKIAGPSEPSSYTWTFAPLNGNKSGVILNYKGASGLSTIGAMIGGAGNINPITLPSINAALEGLLLAVYARTTNRTLVSGPDDMVSRYEFTSAPYINIYEKNPSPSGGTGSKSLTLDGTANSKGVLFQVSRG